MSHDSTDPSAAHRAPDPRTGSTGSTGSDASATASAARDEAQQRAGQVAGTAKDAGSQVAGTAKDAGREVAGTAQAKAADVKDEAAAQAKDLYREGRSQLTQHAGEQQQRAAQGLRAVTTELRGMVDGTDQQGPVTDLARQAADRVDEAARWLGDRDTDGLLRDVRSFAARRPGAFLALAAGAGLLAGRLARGLKDASDDSSSSTTAGTSTGTGTTAAPTYGTAAVGTTTATGAAGTTTTPGAPTLPSLADTTSADVHRGVL
ncbi:hypothetical protein [Pseudokineococcus lusitanus]|jgi:hypothetical protein|uniref:Late embryogenesis abundant protein n=1 Tax=Pseudokineococcus lusitanus TaxID=763993 RepID=A0A3N1G9S1_9ACTN|nr:hypothetical protein [Pseudokineococcus lusitanus]ROP26985.1 hypothetical protein EDC03_2913 [Pseudokineococcus lusitanus]